MQTRSGLQLQYPELNMSETGDGDNVVEVPEESVSLPQPAQVPTGDGNNTTPIPQAGAKDETLLAQMDEMISQMNMLLTSQASLINRVESLENPCEMRGKGQRETGGPKTLKENVQSFQTPNMLRLPCKPPTFNGSGDWESFREQFSTWADLSRIPTESRAGFLRLCLTGDAHIYYCGLTESEKKEYDQVMQRFQERYAGESTEEIAKEKLSTRKRKSGESISELRDDIWRLCRRAYPTLGAEAHEHIAMDALKRAVSDSLRMVVVDQGVKTLSAAATLMERHEIGIRERSKAQVRAVKENPAEEMSVLQSLEERMKKLEAALRSRKVGGSRNNGKPRCYACGGLGHYAKDCDEDSRNNSKPKGQGNGMPSSAE